MYAYSMPQQIKNILTVKHCIALLLLVISTQNSIYADAIDLGARCQHDMDCTDFIKGSTCSANGYCECAPYYVQFNATTCLSSQLLGGDCILNEQCTMKVSNSSCLDGACRCVEGYLQFRKHTCLGPAHPGAVCYSHAHCQMGSIRTHCDFLIPNLFGRCQCTAPARLINGLCLEDAVIEEKLEIVAPAPTPTTTSSTTTTSTTTTSTTTTAAPTTPPAAPVQIDTSTSAPILADLPEEPENESIEEQKLDEQEVEAADNGEELVAAEPEAEAPKGDEDNEANEAEPAEEEVHGAAEELAHDESAPVEANPTTSGPTLVNVAETTVSQMLTPADNAQAGSDVAEEETQTLSPEQAATDDYPYKIEEEYAEETPEQQQEGAQQQQEAAEHAAEQEAAAEAAAVAEEEAEAAAEAEAEAVEDAQHPQHGHESADDTMKFDYENAQDEFDYADQQTEATAPAIVADTAAGKPLATNDDDVSVGNTATPSESDPIAIVKPEPQASGVEETAAEAASAPAEDGAVEQEQYVEEAAAAPAAAEEAKEESEEAEATTSEIENANQQQQEVEAPSVAVAVAETATEQPAKPAAEEAFQQAIDEHENEQQIVAMLQPEANANDEAAQQQQESNDDNIKQEQVEESEPQLTQVDEQQQEVEEEGTAAAEEDEKETETKVDAEEEQQQSVDEPASITEAAIGLIDNDSDTANEAVEAVEPEAEATNPEAPSDSELNLNVPAAPQADEYVESAVIESSPAQSEHSVGQSEVGAVTEEAPQHETEAEASAEEEEDEEYEDTIADNEEATQGPVKAEAEEEQKEQSSEEKTESDEEHDEHEEHEEQTTLASVSDETKVETVESPQETQESAAEVTELDSKTEQPVNVVDRIAEVANEQTQSNDVLNADEEKPIAGSDMAPNTLDDESIQEPTLGVTESAAAESLTENVPEYFAEYAPATSGEHVVESSEHQPEPETNAVPLVEAVLSQDSAEREATTPAVPAEQDEYANMEYESEEQDEQKPDADTDAEVEATQPAVTEQQPMADFEESDSIADILNDLMAESMATEQPQESEAAAQSNAGDLEAEETDVAEEKLGVEQPKPEAVVPAVAAVPNEDTTEEHVATSDKLITFYPELSPENQQPAFEENQAQDVQAAAEPEVTEAPAKLVDEAQQVEEAEAEAESEAQTLSPDELPFDLTSLNDDVQLQTLESANLIVESATQASGELDTNDIEESARVEVIAHTPEPQISEEPTAEPGDIMELTTQTMLGLASRVTLMEPSAPVTTTLQPLMAGEEATPDPSKATQATNMDSSIFTTKATTTEIRKRVELALEAVSLGLPCSNNKQCQLADPNTMCNARGVCDCALSAGASGNPGNGQGQCSAERTGCSAGTFQCRASGVCISWFFVCDGRPDCNDASDEECSFNSRLNQKCPAESFHCERSGRCISRAALCDGRRQCPHGEDELGCNALKSSNGQCPQHTFRCKSGECLPEYEYCNAIISCKDGSDEPPHLCGARTMPNIFARFLSAGGLQSANDPNAYCPHKCSNGRCRSTAIVCSGRDGCGDGTDEQTCAVCRCPAPATESLPLYLARHRPMPLW